MLITTWIVVGVLAAINLLAGGGKALTPWDRLSAKMPWTESTGRGLAYLAAWSEVVGAVGLIVPLMLAHAVDGWEWAAWVSFAAALGLTLVQILAIGVHAKRKEYGTLPVNVVLIVIGVAAAILIAVTR